MGIVLDKSKQLLLKKIWAITQPYFYFGTRFYDKKIIGVSEVNFYFQIVF